MHKSQQRLNTSRTTQQSVCVSVSSWVYIIMVRLKHHDIMLCLSQLTIHFGTQRTPEGPRINMQTHISILIYRRPTSCFKTPTVIVMHAALCPMRSYLWDLSGGGGPVVICSSYHVQLCKLIDNSTKAVKTQ